jgi:hypothetical protein
MAGYCKHYNKTVENFQKSWLSKYQLFKKLPAQLVAYLKILHKKAHLGDGRA